MDFILNGQASGSTAARLLDNGFDVGSLRPYKGEDGRTYITRNENGKAKKVPSMVNNGTLRYNEWKLLDEAVIYAAKPRLRVVADLRAGGLTFNIPEGMGKTMLLTEAVSDITPATISMDPTRQGNTDRPEYDLTQLPLPVIHKDFKFNARQIATSRNLGAPIDTTTAQLAARRVAEEAEQLALGTLSQFSYGGGVVYGMTNYPNRMTRSITLPTSGGWTPAATVNDVLAMKQLSLEHFHFGPWVLYSSISFDQYMNEDYILTGGNVATQTLRERLLKIDGIQDVRTADYLTGYQLVLVQQTTDVIREVIGLDITTVQWETMGGLELNFKVMAILVPQLRSDANGNTGIVHGS